MDCTIDTMKGSRLNTSELSKILKNVSRNYLRLGEEDKLTKCKEYIHENGIDKIEKCAQLF